MLLLQDIKGKIRLVQRIAQVTRALELVSAVKMKKSQRIALNSRPFARKAVEILERLGQYQKKYSKKNSFYFQSKKVKKILVLVVSSDRGFCSAFNQNILRFAGRELEILRREAVVEIMAIGKKAINFFKKKKDFEVKIKFTGIGDYGEFEEIKPIANLLLDYFRKNKYQKIFLFYSDFVSSFLQKPQKIQILPLDTEVFEEMIEKSVFASKKYSSSDYQNQKSNKIKENCEYLFEPTKKEIFENLVPQLIEFEIYQAILESNASEHSARMMAMRNASRNAKDLIETLTLEYNKVRQNQITSELSEISSAKEAMK